MKNEKQSITVYDVIGDIDEGEGFISTAVTINRFETHEAAIEYKDVLSTIKWIKNVEVVKKEVLL